LLIEKRVRRAAPAAQRRLAGEPKAKPGASLPRSEINRQFLPASRFIIRSSSSLGSLGPKTRAFRSKLQMKDMGISHTWKPGYTIKLAAWGLELNPEFQLSSEITFLTFN